MRALVQQSGYVLDPVNNIWISASYEGIDYTDGDEVETRIASIIQQTLDISVLSNELRKNCTDWPSLYHLSGTRANIMRPFENILKGDILEIGAGCGAVTRYLGECGANVLALEGSPRRAAIARSRTRDLENVTVLSEKFGQFQCDHQFDVIVLIGVLEYANLFTSGENPPLAMLERVRSLVKPDGKLIVAIENQLGLKYFAGAPEDHLGQSMYGIEGRYRRDQPQTFGRVVLQEILREAGFMHTVFMAPFPDYKLPFSIVTEAGFNAEDFDASVFAWQSVRRDPQLPPILCFSPELVWPTLERNALALDLANSFLVLAGKREKHDSVLPVYAWHFSTERAEAFCKQTSFLRADNGLIEVHYRSLSKNRSGPADCKLLRFSVPEKAEYAQGRPLSHEFIRIVSRDGWSIDEVGGFFKHYILILQAIAHSRGSSIGPFSANPILPGEFFDYLPQNIIIDDFGAWRLIDEEWVLHKEISARQLIFRASLSLLNSISRFGYCANQVVSSPLEFFQACYASIGFNITFEALEDCVRQENIIQAEVSQQVADSINIHTWLVSPSLSRQTLNGAVAERDGQIAGLNHTVAERDGRIASLNQAVAERDGQIVSLNQAVGERDRQLLRLLASRSWRITKPLRFIGRLLRGDFNSAFAPFRRTLVAQNATRPTDLSLSSSSPHPVAVVLPVYRDVEMTLNCIEAAIPGILEIPLTKLIVINDSSPDAGMQDALNGIANRWPDVVQLLVNDNNLGFVATVNKGMRLYGDHDIVLLNSDVIVPNGWLKRLRDDAYSRADVATVTPLSNNTTICSFPEFLQANSIIFGLDTRAVDEVFAAQRLPCVEAPTGIGFCMYIKHQALVNVGYFNEECFGRGYGEENDFCQRAIKSGYVNLISPNLYVYHRGGVSFGVDKEALVENAMRVIDELHPNYHMDVQRFIAADPLRRARIVRFARLIAEAQIPKILHVSHGLGGGVDQHIEELSDAVDGRAICILLSPRDDGACVEVRLGIKKTADGLFFNLPQEHDELLILLRYLEISLIHYHHVLRLHPALLNLPNDLSVDHVLTIHDFFLLNGNPTLTDKNGVFPGRYNDQLSNPLYPLPGGMTPKKWRDSYRQLIETAKAVIFPTQSTYKLFGDHYAFVRPVVAYHPELSRKVDTPFKGMGKKDRYTIGVIGAISKEKGADLLEDVAMLAQGKRMTLDFVLIGYAYRPLRRIKTTGPYSSDKVQQLLIEHQIDVCFFPARCPETYSYTISSALESGLPIIAPNLGAFPERLANREGVLLFDHLSTADAVLCQMESFIEQNLNGTPPSCPEFAGMSASTCFYKNEYLTLCTKRHNSGDKGMLNIVVGPPLHRRRTVREKILSALWKIYIHRSMRWVDTVVPFTVLRTVKRFISRRSIYEICNR